MENLETTSPGGLPVTFDGVAVQFGEKLVLADVSFSVRPGEILGVIGGSGAGKTTVLNLLTGLLQPSRGEVSIGGAKPLERRKAGGFGYLFQQPTLLPWQKVRDYVALPLRVRDRPLSLLNPFAGLTTTEEAQVKGALNRAKIPNLEEARPTQLSGGMQTRVALARTIVARPQVLLLDEPFNSLDEKLRSEIYQEIQAIVVAYQPTTFLVTHNLVEAVLLCDRVLVLAKTAAQGPASIVAEVAIDLPRPRDMNMFEERGFREALSTLRGAIFAH